jgi:hypothetical protein
MHSPRPSGRIATLLRLTSGLLLLAYTFHTAQAQSTPQTPAPPPAVPAATPAAPNSYPTVPAATPAQQSLPPGGAAPRASSVDASSYPATPPYLPVIETIHHDNLGSAYIPVDSFVYPEALRLYSLGYLDTAFIVMRPWTRRSLLHMLQLSAPKVMSGGNTEAIGILASLNEYLSAEDPTAPMEGLHFRPRGMIYGVQSAYTRFMGVDGQTLHDSFHLGQTLANDYGRPYQAGFNNVTGFSTLNEYGRFSLFVRGEYQRAPSGYGYSNTDTSNPLTMVTENGTTTDYTLASYVSEYLDAIPYSGFNLNQATIPAPHIATQNSFRLQEAALSFHLLGHEISGGKSDAWLGPSLGSAMAWSNNAEDIYSFRINRIEPMYIPYLDKVLGPLRYDFFVGSLKGHTDPNSPWVHSSMFSFAPTSNFQFGFQRTVIWGGEGHVPVTIHTFLRSFFSINDTENDPAAKNSRNDPGARFSDFSFSYRLPFVRSHLTLTLDSICHDDVTPISAPRRAAYRPGLYLSQVPGIPKLDFRVEAVSTDTSTLRSLKGQFNYIETVQLQGYTNKGFIMGDWIGREAKGGQAWLTYHLSGNEWVQLEYLDKKTPKDFIPGGTTQGQFKAEVVKRFHKDIELDAWVQVEKWKAPIYIPRASNGANTDTIAAVQVTWYPKLHAEAPGQH